MNHTFLKHNEGKILLFGLSLLALYFILLFLCAMFTPELVQPFLSITATNVIFGRMAGLSIGIASQMDITLLVAFNLFIESIMVLILYPLFVLSWNKLELISYKPLNDFLERSKVNAGKYEPLIKRYGIIGLILFVLTPFAMTGPVVGSFVGYLIGLRHRMTLFIVLFSTLIAIILWVYLIKNFEEVLVTYSDMIMSGFFIAATLMLIWYVLKRLFR
jgi:uncharacterized membrane protein